MSTKNYTYKEIRRKNTKVVELRNRGNNLKNNHSVFVGGDNLISIQSMTNTLTSDIAGTLEQISECHKLGVDIMRVSVPDKDSSIALKEIVRNSPIPIIADIHFHYKRGIEAVESGVSCIRINPGNIGTKENLAEIVKVCKEHNVPIRVGVNVGSLENNILQKYNNEPCPEALVESAITNIKMIEDLDFNNIKISVKASDVILMVKSYRLLSQQIQYPLHLGLTEAGPVFNGTIKSAVSIGSLLMDGIGDTIRISLSALPQEEVKVCWALLKSLELRSRGVNIISCPSCARQQFDVIKIVSEVESKFSHITKNINISILGCVVNGIGEATRSDIGITGAMSGHHLIYLHGKPYAKSSKENIVQDVVNIVKKEFAD
mgnify:CR=1 FL=1